MFVLQYSVSKLPVVLASDMKHNDSYIYNLHKYTQASMHTYRYRLPMHHLAI